ncbi:MAG: hypothetical protein RL033_7365 [Pseudomonadota bacterium]
MALLGSHTWLAGLHPMRGARCHRAGAPPVYLLRRGYPRVGGPRLVLDCRSGPPPTRAVGVSGAERWHLGFAKWTGHLWVAVSTTSAVPPTPEGSTPFHVKHHDCAP